MATRSATQDETAALEAGRAFVDLSAHRKVRVSGADAPAWLHDLVTCDVASLEPGRAHRSLLLTPTGRIRADFTVAREADGFLLLQASDQPDPMGSLLDTYVLSSDVALRDVTDEMSLIAVPGRRAEPQERPSFAPSVLGSGFDLVAPAGDRSRRVKDALMSQGLIEAGPQALEVWRIHRGAARMGVDFLQGALPAETGLGWTIDTAKGCFLGQESVAKVRNLGHAGHLLRHVRTRGEVRAGTAVHFDGTPAGEVTSAAAAEEGVTVALVRVRWDAAEGNLRTAQGATMEPWAPWTSPFG